MRRNGNDEKQSDSRSILKLELKRFADRLAGSVRTNEQSEISPGVLA